MRNSKTRLAKTLVGVLTAGVLWGCAAGAEARPVTAYKAVEASWWPVEVSVSTPRPTAAPVPTVAPPAKRPPKVVTKPKVVQPKGKIGTIAIGLRGQASWYCRSGRGCTHGYAGGLYAAAGPRVRAALGHWRGRVVTVSTASGSIRVKLIDWCGCPNGRLLDLYSDAFRRLAPLSRGVLTVTVGYER